jgi:tetratricopeptide (TPR) repeat protein
MRDRFPSPPSWGRRPLVALTLFGAVALTCATSTTPARAQGKTAAPAQTPQARAAELFNKGAEAYRRGDFKQAVALLLEAHTLDPQPVLLYNLGRAYEDSGDVDAAIATFSKYIAEDPKAGDRGAIEQRIERLKRQRDERVALEKQRDAERMRADAEKADRERQEREAAKARPGRSVGPYIVAGVGVAGLGTGVVFGLLSKSKHDSASKASTNQQDAIDQQDTAKSFATISTVSFIAGGVLVAAGATWWILDRKASAKPAVGGSSQTFRVGLTPGFLILERGFQ